MAALEHDPEKWVAVFPSRQTRNAFARRSCSNKKIERDDDSKKSHPALSITAESLLSESSTSRVSYEHTYWQDATFNKQAASPLFSYIFRLQDDVVKVDFTVSATTASQRGKIRKGGAGELTSPTP
jgi:hypothetical protein